MAAWVRGALAGRAGALRAGVPLAPVETPGEQSFRCHLRSSGLVPKRSRTGVAAELELSPGDDVMRCGTWELSASAMCGTGQVSGVERDAVAATRLLLPCVPCCVDFNLPERVSSKDLGVWSAEVARSQMTAVSLGSLWQPAVEALGRQGLLPEKHFSQCLSWEVDVGLCVLKHK